MKKDNKEETCKVEREETCFVEAKHLSVTRNSKIGGFNRYKVAILCQGGINKIISSRGNIPKLKSFGGHICGKSTFYTFFEFPVFLIHFLLKHYRGLYLFGNDGSRV